MLTEDSIWEGSVRDVFSSFTITLNVTEAERPRKDRNHSRFLQECRAALRAIPWYSDLSRPRRLLYSNLVQRFAKDGFVAGSACWHHGCAFSGLGRH